MMKITAKQLETVVREVVKEALRVSPHQAVEHLVGTFMDSLANSDVAEAVDTYYSLYNNGMPREEIISMIDDSMAAPQAKEQVKMAIHRHSTPKEPTRQDVYPQDFPDTDPMQGSFTRAMKRRSGR